MNFCLDVRELEINDISYTEMICNQTLFYCRAMRYAAYKAYTWWIHNRLGKGVRKVIPSCALWKIRNKYPSPDNLYTPFMESKIEQNILEGEENLSD